MSIDPRKWRWYGQLLCLLGRHDCDIIEIEFRFADGGCVEKVRCKRCGIIIVRNAQ